MIDHQLLVIRKIIDGDTFYADLEHVVGDSEDVQVITRRHNAKLRLINLQTPERKGDAHLPAKKHLTTWLWARDEELRVRTHGRDVFGRFLADVYTPYTGQTATQYMLGLGYDPYVES